MFGFNLGVGKVCISCRVSDRLSTKSEDKVKVKIQAHTYCSSIVICRDGNPLEEEIV